LLHDFRREAHRESIVKLGKTPSHVYDLRIEEWLRLAAHVETELGTSKRLGFAPEHHVELVLTFLALDLPSEPIALQAIHDAMSGGEDIAIRRHDRSGAASTLILEPHGGHRGASQLLGDMIRGNFGNRIVALVQRGGHRGPGGSPAEQGDDQA